AWIVHAALALSPGTPAATWTATAAAILFTAAITGFTAGRVAVLVLVAAALIPLPARLRNARGAFLLVGLPWLALVAGISLAAVGRFTLFSPGDDFTFFQRFAYRI